MRIIKKAMQTEVWDHWFKTENYEQYQNLAGERLEWKIENWRTDIKSPLPPNMRWHEAEIEETDVSRLYIISSDDWAHISRHTFLVSSVVENLNTPFSNRDSLRISRNIKKMLSFLQSGGTLDTKLILVSDGTFGPFTVLEGNRRAVALLCLNKLVGIRIYAGISDGIKNYIWSRYMYKS